MRALSARKMPETARICGLLRRKGVAVAFPCPSVAAARPVAGSAVPSVAVVAPVEWGASQILSLPIWTVCHSNPSLEIIKFQNKIYLDYINWKISKLWFLYIFNQFYFHHYYCYDSFYSQYINVITKICNCLLFNSIVKKASTSNSKKLL